MNTYYATQKITDDFDNKVSFTEPAELSKLIDDDFNIQIIDVRSPLDYKKGHIPTAVNLPPNEWEKAEEKLDINKVNVFYCYSRKCNLAKKATSKFSNLNYYVKELKGGYKDWIQNKLNIQS